MQGLRLLLFCMYTTTLLEACNEVLLNVGETEVPDLSAPHAKKARLSIQRALRSVASLHNWTYLQKVIQPSSWLNGYATIVPCQDIYTVSLRTDLLLSAGIDELYDRAVRFPNLDGTPTHFSRVDETTIFVYPQPSVVDQADIMLRVLLQQQVPQLAGDDFSLPVDVYDCIMIYAEMLMHRNHTTDSAAMQQCSQEFEMRLHNLRSRDSSQVVFNMGGHAR